MWKRVSFKVTEEQYEALGRCAKEYGSRMREAIGVGVPARAGDLLRAAGAAISQGKVVLDPSDPEVVAAFCGQRLVVVTQGGRFVASAGDGELGVAEQRAIIGAFVTAVFPICTPETARVFGMIKDEIDAYDIAGDTARTAQAMEELSEWRRACDDVGLLSRPIEAYASAPELLKEITLDGDLRPGYASRSLEFSEEFLKRAQDASREVAHAEAE